MRLLPETLLAAAHAGVDVVVESRRLNERAAEACCDAERWSRIALSTTTAEAATRWAALATSAALRAGALVTEIHTLTPGSAADGTAHDGPAWRSMRAAELAAGTANHHARVLAAHAEGRHRHG